MLQPCRYGHLQVLLANTEAKDTDAGGQSGLQPHQGALVDGDLGAVGCRAQEVLSLQLLHLRDRWVKSLTNTLENEAGQKNYPL